MPSIFHVAWIVASLSYLGTNASAFSASSSSSRSSSRLTMSTSNNHDNGNNPSRPLPNLPIPPPILSNVPGTWAYDTMSRRVDEEILERTVQDCADDLARPEFAVIRANIEALRTELRNAATTKLSPLTVPLVDKSNGGVVDPERAKEWQEWNEILEPHYNDTWLTAPWMVTEFYVYRRLMQCFEYWNPDSVGYMYDPFDKQKRAGLVSSTGSAEPALAKVPNLPSTMEGLGIATSLALWGNKMDLSLWPADASAANTDVFSSILASATENLLHDDTEALSKHCDSLRAKGGGNVDIIVDNAGFELVTDLALAQYLVQSGIASCVTFQLKSHPTFVSDALTKDLQETVEYYAALDSATYPAAAAAGQTWRGMLERGEWKCVEDNFWVQAYPMWKMTEPLRSELQSRCDLAFCKGDANYRRLLGDCTWDYSAPFQDVVGCYFPTPICALRTLKAELGCGMDMAEIRRAKALDEKCWMTNGRFGVVQFGGGSGAAK